jgi:hypothetical protein
MANPTDQDGGGTKKVNLAELFQFREMRAKLEELLSNNDRTPANDAKIAHGPIPRAFFTPAPHAQTTAHSKTDQDKDEPKGPKP